MTDLIGKSLGRYHILEQLGQGGMAIVYKAYDTRLDTDVAVKFIRTDNIPPNILEQTLKRFEREAKSLARLTHPNIVKVTDYGEFEDKPYLVMPLLTGGTLKDRVKKSSVSWQEAVRLVITIGEALEYAHKHNLIHRDVKPANVLITENGQPMLTDFGVAKLFDTDTAADLTGTGMGVGTPEYMAPEQWQGEVSVQTDVYSLGIVLYELVTGKRPFSAETPAALLIKLFNDPLPRPTQSNPNLPEAIEKVLIKALARDLNERYKTMSEFLAALENLNVQSATRSYAVPAEVEETKLEIGTQQSASPRGPSADQGTLVEGIPPQSPSAPRKTNWLPWAIGIGVAGLIGIIALGFIPTRSSGVGPAISSTSTSTSAPVPSKSPVKATATIIPKTSAPTRTLTPKPSLNVSSCDSTVAGDCPDNATYYRDLYPNQTLTMGGTYPATISGDIPVRFFIGWCTLEGTQLAENLPHILFVFTINDKSFLSDIEEHYFTVQDSDNPSRLNYCYGSSPIVSGWQKGIEYRVVIGIKILSEINDGWDTYQPGDRTRTFVITRK